MRNVPGEEKEYENEKEETCGWGERGLSSELFSLCKRTCLPAIAPC